MFTPEETRVLDSMLKRLCQEEAGCLKCSTGSCGGCDIYALISRLEGLKKQSVKENLKTEKLHQECYRLYQLDWMRGHGYGPEDLVRSFFRYAADSTDPDETEKELYAGWQVDSGFGGELWASMDEFMETEYLDGSYMLRLLPAAMHPDYMRDRQGRNAMDPS